jgi:hypothetical protein
MVGLFFQGPLEVNCKRVTEEIEKTKKVENTKRKIHYSVCTLAALQFFPKSLPLGFCAEDLSENGAGPLVFRHTTSSPRITSPQRGEWSGIGPLVIVLCSLEHHVTFAVDGLQCDDLSWLLA